MSVPVSITIGIPTYNRADAVVARVRELLALRRDLDFHILVADNASSDGTFDRLTAEFAALDVELRRNEQNLGLAGNLLRLIEHSKTDYLTFVSDEDTVEAQGLFDLVETLRARRPRLVSPRAQVGDNDCYRGRRLTSAIAPEEFDSASYYLSGITVEVSGAKRNAETVAAFLPDNAAAVYYPQVLLTALAMLDGEAIFLDSLVTRQVVELETHLSSYGRGAYWFVPSRWAQFEGYEDFFASTAERLPEAAPYVRQMRESIRASVFSLLHAGAIAQFPDLAGHVPPPYESLLGRMSRVVRRK